MRAAHARHVRDGEQRAAHASRSRRIQSEDLSACERSATRWAEQRAQFRARAAGLPDIGKHRDPLAKCNPDRVERRHAADETEAEWLVFGSLGKAAEQTVEHDQDAAIVLVEAGLVAGMMHAMVPRRVEHPFERAEI
ncbi:DUF294 nucleotidyltransferase-like domain-containing protein [Bradyrhizobium sp. GCM10027634]|uniref:DUF294 nucleotidyltransferase-like domain-containing protein n=1 Tax=unclassified Bradyrhizobium TaxID=2631580 RepID=UPI0034610AAF